MIDFEAYDIDAWMTGGLAMPFIAKPQTAKRQRNISYRAKFLVPAVAAAAVILQNTTPLTQYFIQSAPRFERAIWPRDVMQISPSQYWSEAIAALTRAPMVEESGPTDPPPRY